MTRPISHNLEPMPSDRLGIDPKRRRMSAAEYREVIDKLGFTQEGGAQFVGMTGRQGQTWARDGVKNGAAAILFRVMAAYEIDPHEVEAVLRHG